MKKAIPLGFELGSGDPVAIPLHHLAVTGQTQLSGKTTTLEALITRSGLSAIAFVTKRGEGSFTASHPLPPYFRERADWQFVSAVLEATLRERLKFERAWIMRASKGARSLADVQANVRAAMEKAKGLAADVYFTLDQYLDIVVPQIEALPYRDAIALKAGVNVMDLSAYSTELQALVIRSVIEWVYREGKGVVVVIPEAWEFIPQNRGSPVLLACEELIRKGGNLGNFVWLDSQDIAGVHKNILRSVGVWILGVQREANEVKRALSHIPGNVRKPKIDEVMELERGQFFACFGKEVRKVYVQPAWLDDGSARAIARGDEDVWVQLQLQRLTAEKPKEVQVDEREALQLHNENRELRSQVAALRETVARLEQQLTAMPAKAPAPAAAQAKPSVEHAPPAPDIEAIWADVKRRALADPMVLRVLTELPELEVTVEKRTVEIDGKSLKGRIARLIAEGFFDGGADNSATRSELKRTGADSPNSNIEKVLEDLQRDGFLVREGKAYKAVRGMKVNIVERAA